MSGHFRLSCSYLGYTSKDRHFSQSIQSRDHCENREIGSLRVISSLKVYKMLCSELCKTFIAVRMT